jgi:hypothetical protein
MDFPRFDGTDPSIWKDNCEMYFEIYGISDLMKVNLPCSISLATQPSGSKPSNPNNI